MENGASTLETSLKNLHERGDFKAAATLAVQGYGPEIVGFLLALVRSSEAATEVFSMFCEDLWMGLPKFRWHSSFRTWAYTLARHAAYRFRKDPHNRRRVGLSEYPDIWKAEQQVRSTTLTYLRSEVRDRVSRLRDQLEPDEQTILILRVDKNMSWNEIAHVMLPPDDQSDSAGIARQVVALRKRFERIKLRLRDLLASEHKNP